MRKFRRIIVPLLVILVALVGWLTQRKDVPVYSDSVKNVPAFTDQAYVIINNNQPEFSEEDITTKAYEYYSDLDAYGRCGYAMACLGLELMPTEDRESISDVKPSGWVQAQYDLVEGENLYNRCHLIGFQLSGENANKENLITGTRYLNVEGMLPFENKVADYIKDTGNHVIYRVTPIYEGSELVARGVQLEAKSVEDDGICFHVYVYNNQPGVIIDYATGESWLDGEQLQTTTKEQTGSYILNTNSKKFHGVDCGQAKDIKDTNKEIFSGSREELLQKGYTASKCCNP